MKKFAAAVLLLTALVLPVVMSWLLISRSEFSVPVAAVIAIASGWALNMVWAFAIGKTTPKDPSQANGNYFAIATRFGWACPAVLVLLTWLVWHFTTGGAA